MKKPSTTPQGPTGATPKLPQILLKAWRQCIISNGKFPEGTAKATDTEENLLRILAKSERGAITRLWRTFTQERDALSARTMTDKRNAVAYLLGFHLPNLARALHAVNNSSKRASIKPALESFASATIVDIGCGSGAMAQASLSLVKGLKKPIANVNLRLIDASGPLLDAATLMLQGIDPDADIRTHRGRLDTLAPGKYLPDVGSVGIYNLGYVWNEIAKNPRARNKIFELFEKLIANKVPALVFITEPGTQDQSRSAMVLRNQLTSLGYQVYYPCPSNAPCPLLERSRDWCYSEIPWNPPAIQKLVDKFIGIERSKLAASCYALATPAMGQMIELKLKNMQVVVGRPVKAPKGQATSSQKSFEYLLCTSQGPKKTPATPGKPPLDRGTIFDATPVVKK
jgi:hypothetical protein